ncbi:hypothetical protein [Dyadobacter sandarakinus]|uniref:Uncharacterized protein n=1 Tax=Dyadobacter sandarakinus TaxID=2747268 RepID=A0ABX7I7W9_9BACT|nr:hypothetical protein [Dyadobacter sandarakinus]QRR02030.1 hypothetical protein HWI92_14495 [Dyadobacter sandarakinus]
MMTRNVLWLFGLLFITIIHSCRQKDTLEQKADDWYASLHDNQARIEVKIGDTEFYGQKSLFTGQVTLFEDLFSTTLTDQFQGRMIISMGGKDWYRNKPIIRKVVAENEINASVKMGKIIDQKQMVGEGYMMADGQIEALTFTEDKIVLKITGKAGKYSDFAAPDHYLPVEGLIVYKKPSINTGGLSKEKVFGPNTSK